MENVDRQSKRGYRERQLKIVQSVLQRELRKES